MPGAKKSETEINEFLQKAEKRFSQNKKMHLSLKWKKLEEYIKSHPAKLKSWIAMEGSGGEPCVLEFKTKKANYIVIDCSTESPAGRRSLCFDEKALQSRKKNKPEGSTENMAKSMGIELVTEEMYRHLQTQGEFDLKTSSWIQTPEKIRELGGALFGDRRYDTVFVYHNGAESYYAARGFRGYFEINV